MQRVCSRRRLRRVDLTQQTLSVGGQTVRKDFMETNKYDAIIKSYRDVAIWTGMVRDYENRLLDMSNPKAKEHCDEIKRAIRRFYKKVCDKAAVGETGFGEYDYFTRKYPLPEYIETKAEAEEYFEEYEWMHCYPSQYDCTGQIFTTRYCVFQKPDGRWWVYHCMAMDV